MNKKIEISALIIFCIILFSCRKYGNGYIKGTVYEKGTGLPVSGVDINILGDYHSNNIHQLYSTTTKENGEYLLNYKKKHGYGYDLYASNKVDQVQVKSPEYKKAAINFEIYSEAKVEIIAKKMSNSQNHIEVLGPFNIASSPNYNYPFEIFLAPVELKKFTPTDYYYVRRSVSSKFSWRVMNGTTLISTHDTTLTNISGSDIFTCIIPFN